MFSGAHSIFSKPAINSSNNSVDPFKERKINFSEKPFNNNFSNQTEKIGNFFPHKNKIESLTPNAASIWKTGASKLINNNENSKLTKLQNNQINYNNDVSNKIKQSEFRSNFPSKSYQNSDKKLNKFQYNQPEPEYCIDLCMEEDYNVPLTPPNKFIGKNIQSQLTQEIFHDSNNNLNQHHYPNYVKSKQIVKPQLFNKRQYLENSHETNFQDFDIYHTENRTESNINIDSKTNKKQNNLNNKIRNYDNYENLNFIDNKNKVGKKEISLNKLRDNEQTNNLDDNFRPKRKMSIKSLSKSKVNSIQNSRQNNFIEKLGKNTSKIEKPNLKKKFSAKKQQNTLPLTENKVKENTSLKEVKRDKKLLKKISNKKTIPNYNSTDIIDLVNSDNHDYDNYQDKDNEEINYENENENEQIEVPKPVVKKVTISHDKIKKLMIKKLNKNNDRDTTPDDNTKISDNEIKEINKITDENNFTTIKSKLTSMCSIDEIRSREQQNLLSLFEIDKNKSVIDTSGNRHQMKASYHKCVKAFKRSAADQKMDNPENVRTEIVSLFN